MSERAETDAEIAAFWAQSTERVQATRRKCLRPSDDLDPETDYLRLPGGYYLAIGPLRDDN
jgi:hypothetical protein